MTILSFEKVFEVLGADKFFKSLKENLLLRLDAT